MAEDINIGSDALLTTELTGADRITITRSATGQQLGTMTMANFMAKCAAMMPVATADANGAMSAADRASYPAGNTCSVFSRYLNIGSGRKYRIQLIGGGTNTVAKVRCVGTYYYANSNGVIEKWTSLNPSRRVASRLFGATSTYLYVSDIISESGGVYVDIINKYSNNNLCFVQIEAYASSPITYSGAGADATAAEIAKSNTTEV